MKAMSSPQARYDKATGFTLLELLVALGLIGIIMTAVLNLNIRTGSATAMLQARSDLTSETQIAQNYIASKIRNAVYIYPYSVGVSNFVLASSGYSTFNSSSRYGFAGTGNWNWRYGAADGTDPFVAFVLPPTGSASTLTTGSCAAAFTAASVATTAVAKALAEDAKKKSCYSFYAYYALPRTSLTTGDASGSVPTGNNKLQADPNNDSKVWVLMEYRSYFTGAGYSTSVNSGFVQGGTGRLVLDYLKPTTQIGTDKLFFSGNGNMAAPPNSITVNLASTRFAGGQTVNVPSTGRYNIAVYPRNLNAVILNN